MYVSLRLRSSVSIEAQSQWGHLKAITSQIDVFFFLMKITSVPASFRETESQQNSGSSIGNFTNLTSPAVGDCVGYANSIITLSSEIQSLRLQRDTQISAVNTVKNSLKEQQLSFNNFLFSTHLLLVSQCFMKGSVSQPLNFLSN